MIASLDTLNAANIACAVTATWEVRMSEPPVVDVGSGADRRRLQRYRCDVGITIEWGAAHLEGRVFDISSVGMFVTIEDPLWIGAQFSASLALSRSLHVECVVCRVQPRRGMAVSYVVPEQADSSALTAYLASLDTQ
jgi:hypothetical protein